MRHSTAPLPVREWCGLRSERCRGRPQAFGYDSCLYESNWFVNVAMGDSYGKTARALEAALDRAGATPEEKAKVFVENAKKAYRL